MGNKNVNFNQQNRPRIFGLDSDNKLHGSNEFAWFCYVEEKRKKISSYPIIVKIVEVIYRENGSSKTFAYAI